MSAVHSERVRKLLERYFTWGAVLIAVLAVSAISIWDTEQQSRRAVERLAQSQGTLARALALDLDGRIQAAERSGASPSEALTRATGAVLEESKTLVPPRQTLIFVTVGQRLGDALDAKVPRVQRLLMTRGDSLELTRDEAQSLGLPRRRAVAAWRPSNREGLGVLIIATAALERRDAEREELVSVVSIAAISLIVIGLGAVALRRDAERLRLEHTLERQRLERERDEQLARAERIAMASALSLGIAHELATPLGVISLRVEGLKRHADEKQAAALEAIAEQVRQMKQVMQGFLSLARGDAPASTRLEPITLVKSAVQLVSHRFAAAGVLLELELPQITVPVLADESLARQALANLLINAVQASRDGQRVRVDASHDATHVALHVTDEGEGVAPEIADQVMRPFVTTRTDAGGSGLGLAITQELARHQGGTVTLAPGPGGRGTRATLALPRFPEEESR